MGGGGGGGGVEGEEEEVGWQGYSRELDIFEN